MSRLPLLEGAYSARGWIANAQRCVNLYPEINPKDSPVPITHYPTPGLKVLSSHAGACWRGLYLASWGQAYGVLDDNLYIIDSAGQLVAVGPLTAATNATAPVKMWDNGIDLAIVDTANTNGFFYSPTSGGITKIVDPLFTGASNVMDLDGFLVFSSQAANDFISTLDFSRTFDPTYIAKKAGNSDPLQTLIVMHREIWLLGRDTTEIWYNAGNAGFPFQIMPGSFVEVGCASAQSAFKGTQELFWLGQNYAGGYSFFRGAGYKAEAISTPAIDNMLAEMARLSHVDDAVGFFFWQNGHRFCQWNFPTADKTLRYDDTTGMWHEAVWLDGNGYEHRHRANCVMSAFGKIFAGDYQNGKLYQLDLDTYDDDGVQIVRRRGFPHVISEGQGVGQRIGHSLFMADVQTGMDPNLSTPENPPQMFLRWSDDRGATFGSPVGQDMGATGVYRTFPTWQNLGQPRDRVYELFWSTPGDYALNGAWIDILPLRT